ncbi:TMEM175 family protein [Lactococcus termiticola]|uniref:Putative integral membrane protein n=1 Tax=Lactococcus termiticola TaxID=2169526 RepID=A0A2R5HFZ8_9LACT|nr:TMEM175 family protein [Lactococcus termiticola]GBG96993.1 putative integral membrane protein [Lactococcus termiticola]
MKKLNTKVAVYDSHMIGVLRSFSDAVMSIIATLMVLEIPLPKLLSTGHYEFSETLNSLVIFFVSFLVIVGFYFRFVNFFKKIEKISGWQVFAYAIFLMLIALFPFMTQANNNVHPTLFTIIYIAYIVLTTRYSRALRARIMAFNGLEVKKAGSGLSWDYILMTVLAVVVTIFLGNWSGYVLLYLPLRALIGSVVFDEEM